MTGNDILYLVIPCYNEEAVLHETAKQLLEKMNSMFDPGHDFPGEQNHVCK